MPFITSKAGQMRPSSYSVVNSELVQVSKANSAELQIQQDFYKAHKAPVKAPPRKTRPPPVRSPTVYNPIPVAITQIG